MNITSPGDENLVERKHFFELISKLENTQLKAMQRQILMGHFNLPVGKEQ